MPMVRPQPHVLVLATYAIAAPIHSNRGAAHAPLIEADDGNRHKALVSPDQGTIESYSQTG